MDLEGSQQARGLVPAQELELASEALVLAERVLDPVDLAHPVEGVEPDALLQGAVVQGRGQSARVAARDVAEQRLSGQAVPDPQRGQGQRPVTWVDAGEATQDRRLDLMELDEALQRLESLDGELSTIVELRFFGGLSHEEIARELGVSLTTIERRWRLARAWLHAELRS